MALGLDRKMGRMRITFRRGRTEEEVEYLGSRVEEQDCKDDQSHEKLPIGYVAIDRPLNPTQKVISSVQRRVLHFQNKNPP